jgi:dTDP-4-dehydrorhamnose 3,5-epimerase-like enzyme
MKVQVTRLAAHSDLRGSVWEPIGAGELPAQRNCHIVITQPGGIRGNHFHKIGTEIATQAGPALVRYRDETGTHSVKIAEGEVLCFTFPPGCPHALLNNGSGPNVLSAFNTRAFAPEEPDVYPEVLIETGE